MGKSSNASDESKVLLGSTLCLLKTTAVFSQEQRKSIGNPINPFLPVIQYGTLEKF
jgi:hypothetical protein